MPCTSHTSCRTSDMKAARRRLSSPALTRPLVVGLMRDRLKNIGMVSRGQVVVAGNMQNQRQGCKDRDIGSWFPSLFTLRESTLSRYPSSFRFPIQKIKPSCFILLYAIYFKNKPFLVLLFVSSPQRHCRGKCVVNGATWNSPKIFRITHCILVGSPGGLPSFSWNQIYPMYRLHGQV